MRVCVCVSGSVLQVRVCVLQVTVYSYAIKTVFALSHCCYVWWSTFSSLINYLTPQKVIQHCFNVLLKLKAESYIWVVCAHPSQCMFPCVCVCIHSCVYVQACRLQNQWMPFFAGMCVCVCASMHAYTQACVWDSMPCMLSILSLLYNYEVCNIV